MADERAQIARIVRDLDLFIATAVSTVAIDVLDALREATPVDTGYGRTSWRPSIGEPDFREGRRGAGGIPAAARAQKAGRAKVMSLRRARDVHIVPTGYLTTVDERRPFVRAAIRDGIEKARRRGLRVR